MSLADIIWPTECGYLVFWRQECTEFFQSVQCRLAYGVQRWANWRHFQVRNTLLFHSIVNIDAYEMVFEKEEPILYMESSYRSEFILTWSTLLILSYKNFNNNSMKTLAFKLAAAVWLDHRLVTDCTAIVPRDVFVYAITVVVTY